jgi:hypothetical protein
LQKNGLKVVKKLKKKKKIGHDWYFLFENADKSIRQSHGKKCKKIQEVDISKV